jgi:drug/metabolite transporter (DMT)-like permease
MRSLNWELVSLLEFSSVSLMLLLLMPFIRGQEVVSVTTIRRGLRSPVVIGAAVIQLLGVLALNIGLARSTANGGAIVTAISACYPILTIFLALKHFRKRVKLLPFTGALVGIVGVVVLSLG